MEYVIGLFDDRATADRAVDALRDAGVARADYSVTDRSNTFKGWFERLFRMGEDASSLEAQGIPDQDARWYDDQIDRGATMVVVRAHRDSGRAGRLLREAGARGVHVYGQRQGRWVQVPGEAAAPGAPAYGGAPERGVQPQAAVAPAPTGPAPEPPVAPDRRPVEDVVTGGTSRRGVAHEEAGAREGLEAENARLKRLVAEQALEIERLRAGGR